MQNNTSPDSHDVLVLSDRYCTASHRYHSLLWKVYQLVTLCNRCTRSLNDDGTKTQPIWLGGFVLRAIAFSFCDHFLLKDKLGESGAGLLIREGIKWREGRWICASSGVY